MTFNDNTNCSTSGSMTQLYGCGQASNENCQLIYSLVKLRLRSLNLTFDLYEIANCPTLRDIIYSAAHGFRTVRSMRIWKKFAKCP